MYARAMRGFRALTDSHQIVVNMAERTYDALICALRAVVERARGSAGRGAFVIGAHR